MRFYLFIAMFALTAFFAKNSPTSQAAPCNCQNKVVVSQPVSVNRVVSSSPAAPTSYLVSRPVVMQSTSTPVDIHIAPSAQQTFHSYEMPLRSSASDSVATAVSDSYTVSSEYVPSAFPSATVVERRIVSVSPVTESTIVRREILTSSNTEVVTSLAPLTPLVVGSPPKPSEPNSTAVSVSSEPAKKNIDLRFADDLKAMAKRSQKQDEAEKTPTKEQGDESGRKLLSFGDDLPLTLPAAKETPKRITLSKPESVPLPVFQETSKDIPKNSLDLAKKAVPPTVSTLRGQSTNLSSSLQDVFSSPPPLPQGQVNPGVIPETLLEDSKSISDEDLTLVPPIVMEPKKPSGTKEKRDNIAEKAPVMSGEAKANGTLLIATIMSIVSLVFVIVIAFDYYQRWLQSLTTLNNRFSLPGEEESFGLRDLPGSSNAFYGDGFLSPSYYSSDYFEPSTRF